MADMTRSEQLLNAIATGEPSGCAAMTRREKFLAYLAGECDAPPSKAYTREEKLLAKICENGPGGGGGGGGTTEPGKPYIDTSKMTSFYYFFNQNSNFDVIEGIDTSNATNLNYMFNNCTELENIPQLNTSKVTDFSNMFYGCSNLKTIPQLNTSKGTRFGYMFRGCWSIQTIQLDTSNGTYFSNIFYGCRALETLSLTTANSNFDTNGFYDCYTLKNLTIGEGWAVSIYLNYSNKLTVESLHGMIENLADLTGQTARVFKIGATNLAKIDEAHLAMLDAKNWEYS